MTLDESFEKKWLDLSFGPAGPDTKEVGEYFYEAAWNARQPEIDLLKHEIESRKKHQAEMEDVDIERDREISRLKGQRDELLRIAKLIVWLNGTGKSFEKESMPVLLEDAMKAVAACEEESNG